MLKRLLVLAAAVGSLAAPLSAQTIFRATGGDVVFTPTGFSPAPFELYLEAVGIQPRRLIASEDGTSFTLVSKGSVGNGSFGTLGSLTLGNFAAGAGLAFDFVADGVTYNSIAIYLVTAGGYNVQFFSGAGNGAAGEKSINFRLTGVNSIENFHCTLGGVPLVVCPADIPPAGSITATPEPGTIALFATGLAGLLPVVIRRRRAVSPS